MYRQRLSLLMGKKVGHEVTCSLLLHIAPHACRGRWRAAPADASSPAAKCIHYETLPIRDSDVFKGTSRHQQTLQTHLIELVEPLLQLQKNRNWAINCQRLCTSIHTNPFLLQGTRLDCSHYVRMKQHIHSRWSQHAGARARHQPRQPASWRLVSMLRHHACTDRASPKRMQYRPGQHSVREWGRRCSVPCACPLRSRLRQELHLADSPRKRWNRSARSAIPCPCCHEATVRISSTHWGFLPARPLQQCQPDHSARNNAQINTKRNLCLSIDQSSLHKLNEPC